MAGSFWWPLVCTKCLSLKSSDVYGFGFLINYRRAFNVYAKFSAQVANILLVRIMSTNHRKLIGCSNICVSIKVIGFSSLSSRHCVILGSSCLRSLSVPEKYESKVNIPRDFQMSVSSISRKTYPQLLFLKRRKYFISSMNYTN